MVKKSLSLTIEDKTYQVEVLRAGAIAVDGNVYEIEMEPNGVRVNGDLLVASLSEGFAIVGGKLYETEWQIE